MSICPHCNKCAHCGRGPTPVTSPPYAPSPTTWSPGGWWGITPPPGTWPFGWDGTYTTTGTTSISDDYVSVTVDPQEEATRKEIRRINNL